MVYRIAITQVKNKEDAEDIFQEVFMSLVKNLDGIEDGLHLKHWLIRATVNRCKNNQLSFWKRKVVLSEEAAADEADYCEEDFIIDKIRDEIGVLSSKLRSVVYLYYYEKYSVNEIASSLEVPGGTVKSRLYSARNILKDKLEEDFYREYPSNKAPEQLKSKTICKMKTKLSGKKNRIRSKVALLIACVPVFFTLTAFCFNIFSGIDGDELILQTNYKGAGIVEVTVENLSQKI